MLGKPHMFRKVSGAIAIAASLAIIFASPAGAARAHTHSQACQAGGSWISVADDQGVFWLSQIGAGSCVSALACADGAATSSRYPGWITVTDDNGIAWLYPAELSGGSSRPVCAVVSSESVVVSARTPTTQVLSSPYPGWVFVTDDNGITNLEPIALHGG